MVKVTTSIKIDNEKRELAKRRGLVLSDILDQALDIALGLELKESTNLMNSKEDLLQQIEVIENEKEKFLKNHNKQLQTLEDDKEKFLKKYLKDHESKLQDLETEKELYLKNYENNINEIDFKLKSIDQALQTAIIEDKEETKLKEYDQLVRRGAKFGGIDNDIDLIKDIDKFYDKYEDEIGDYDQFTDKLKEDLVVLMFEGKYDLQL